MVFGNLELNNTSEKMKNPIIVDFGHINPKTGSNGDFNVPLIQKVFINSESIHY